MSVIGSGMIFSKNVKSISWKAFRWLFGSYVIILLIAGAVVHIFLGRKVGTLPFLVPEFLNFIDEILIYAFWGLTLFMAGFIFLFIRRFLFPLEVLMVKGKAVENGQYNARDGLIIGENWGEWCQLDGILNKIFRDLKKRKAELEKERGELEAVIAAANDAILAVDRDMNIRYYNGALSLFFDQKEEESLGHNLREVIRNSPVIEAFQRALKERVPQRIQTELELSRDSAIHFFEISISPFFDEKKIRPHGAVAVFHDMTEYKRIGKVRMDFVANASHELKTPLTSVQGYMDHIRESCSEKAHLNEAFEVVENNLNRLSRLINDLLELSKIESAEIIKKQKLQVSEVTENILFQLQSSIKGKKHNLSTVYNVTELTTNREVLEQIIINLMENAIKYCPDFSDIRLHWGLKDSCVFFSVKDNGPGIESHHQGRLFERFYRVRDESSRKIEGTGLGLSIVRNSMQKLGGTVDVKSVPGLGSEFICYFP